MAIKFDETPKIEAQATQLNSTVRLYWNFNSQDSP